MILKSLWQKRKPDDSDSDQDGGSALDNEDTSLDVQEDREALTSDSEREDGGGASDTDDAAAVSTDSTDQSTNDNVNNEHVSRATQFRYRAALQGGLSFNPLDNLRILIGFLNGIKFPGPMRDELKKITLTKDEGHLNQRQIRYRVKKLIDKISNPSETSVTLLLKHWLGLLFEHPQIEKLFSDASVDIDQKYLPEFN